MFIQLKKTKDRYGRIETIEFRPTRDSKKKKSKNSFEINRKKRKERSKGSQVRRERKSIRSKAVEDRCEIVSRASGSDS